MRPLVAFMLLALASCGTSSEVGSAGPPGAQGAVGPAGAPAPTIDSQIEVKSGSRLKAYHRYTTGDDGSRGDLRVFGLFEVPYDAAAPTPWFDSKLGEPCRLNYAADGALRCLPRLFVYVGPLFLDDACTLPTASEAVLGPERAFHFFGVPTPSATDANPTLEVHPVKSVSTTPPTKVWSRSDGACTAADPSSLPNPYVIGGPALPPDSFVAITVTRDDP